ncbi:hypothetical protein SAMN04487954_11735 [Billgrantia gudaonensis]|uniref:DUF1365 domain-containing protein n=2 Tax=Billgrantia gudaonensis TaxID=376427 RepID=A0A1G9C682_9GAMM|nr:hypothetical protein SAMN04487954_11735 [Halomonas gudaonensis]
MASPRSRLYRGTLRHRRFVPLHHAFHYRLWMLWLDLDELPGLFDGVPGFSARRPALARYRREDYLSPHGPALAEVARSEVARQLGSAPAGRVCLLTQLRTLGSGFNPLSLYYLHDEADQLRAVLGEVTNTPWGERTRYACAVDPRRHSHGAQFAKALHVSPFHPMDMTYRWRFNTPGEALLLHMENWKAGERHFDATLTLTGAPATRRALLAALASQPAMNFATRLGIHWQALRLWLKGVPIHDHPGPAPAKETTR